MKTLTKHQATVKVVDLLVRHRITMPMIMKELAYALKHQKEIQAKAKQRKAKSNRRTK